jgi:hypothetical protein
VARGTGHICVDGLGLHLATVVVKLFDYFFIHMLSCIFIGGIIGSTNELSCILCIINYFLTLPKSYL